VQRVADSFTWPFRASPARWLVGCACVIGLPILFIPLLGYSVAATRASEPPPWSISWRLLSDGFWTSLVISLTALPFVVAFLLLRPLRDGAVGVVIVAAALLLVWGLVALLFLPHAAAAFAASGRPADLFDFSASLRGVRADVATWNVVVAAIVSGWAIGLACVALLCVGIVPGVFYAILVSAHATAALRSEAPRSPTR
jgi:hypothetical protein